MDEGKDEARPTGTGIIPPRGGSEITRPEPSLIGEFAVNCRIRRVEIAMAWVATAMPILTDSSNLQTKDIEQQLIKATKAAAVVVTEFFEAKQ